MWIVKKKVFYYLWYKSILLIVKAGRVGKFNRITLVQPSVFRRQNFSRRILPPWSQALIKGKASYNDDKRSFTIIKQKGFKIL